MILVLHKYFSHRFPSSLMQTKRIGIKNNSSVDIQFAEITKIAQALRFKLIETFFQNGEDVVRYFQYIRLIQSRKAYGPCIS